MAKIKNLSFENWKPDRPVSKGASAYHKAVANTSWHKENIKELINLTSKKIKAKDIVVDFGAGTGSSAIYFLKNKNKNFSLILADNSSSWLGKAYEILNKKVTFLLLKKGDSLEKILGKNQVNHVISANTVHLIPNIKWVFRDIYISLRRGGTFSFQSGNILNKDIEKDVLMIDSSINAIHDLAVEIIRKDRKFSKYKKGLDKKIDNELSQRRFVFPSPRPIDFYLKILKELGFKKIKVSNKKIRVNYKDWLGFVRVRRLQAGILPEVGGKDATTIEERDRDEIIKRASKVFFKFLENQNSLSNKKSFVSIWTYVICEK